MDKDVIVLKRVASNASGTTGVLVNEAEGWPAGVSLEPPVPIIPPGIYDVIPYFSPAHQHDCFLIQDVPGHDGVEMHIGNWARDTKGCVLTADHFGLFDDPEMVEESASEFGHLWAKYGTTGFKLDVRALA
jgi:Family of unknown function (DUF5675)